MNFQDIIAISDENKRIKAYSEFGSKKSLTTFQKIKYISTLKNKEYVLDFLRDDPKFDVDVFIYTLNAVFSSDARIELATDSQYEWLRKKVQSSYLSARNINSILTAFGDKNMAMRFFDQKAPYYKENKELIMRGTTKKYDESVIEEIGKFNQNTNIDSKKKKELKDLFSVNEDVLGTVDFRILGDRFSRLKKHVTVISRYPEIEEKIINLTDNELNFLCDAIDFFDDYEIDWIPVADDILTNIKGFSTLVNNEMNVNSRGYNNNVRNNPAQFMKLLTYISDSNKYDVSSLNDVLNSKRRDALGKTIDDKFFKLSDTDKYRQLIFEKVFGLNLEEAMRLYEYYCLDYDNVIKETYWDEKRCADYIQKIKDLNPSNLEYKKIQRRIKLSNTVVRNYTEFSHKVMNMNLSELQEFYINCEKIPEQMIPKSMMDSLFREFFMRLKNETLYIPQESDAMVVDGEKVYLMPDDSRWVMTSLEAYTKFNEKRAVPNWFSKNINNHLIHCSYVGAENFAHPPINGVVYGLAKIDERALIKSAPYDLGGWAYSKDFDAYKKESIFKPRFTTPKTQLNESMRRHGEDCYERENYKFMSDSTFKLPPYYTVSYVEPPLADYFKRPYGEDEVLTMEVLWSIVDNKKMNDLSYRNQIIERELTKDEKWDKTKKDAQKNHIKYKNVADVTHSLITQRLLMDKKEIKALSFTNEDLNNPAKMNEFLQVIEEIIVDFDSARAGVVQREVLDWKVTKWGMPSDSGDIIHKEMYYKLFSTKVMDNKLWKIERLIDTFDRDKYKICMEKLKSVARKQIDKLEKQYWWYECDPAHDWNGYVNYTSRVLSGITWENENDIIKDLLDKNVAGTALKGGELVLNTIKDIERIGEYDIPAGTPDWHGRRHINDVVLFSYLLAQRDGNIPDKIDLVVQAAKYHDVGRDGIWNGLGNGLRHDESVVPHAYPSALAAEFYMKRERKPDGSRKYSDEDIALVKVAIEYHEVYEKDKNKFNTDVFMNLCKKENVSSKNLDACRRMCLCLKDADALDRTRFMLNEDGTLMNYKEFPDNLDYRYLHSNDAVAFRDFARGINEKHYINRTGKVYIPEILDAYRTAYVSKMQSKNALSSEIIRFMKDKNIDFNPSKPNNITPENIQSIIGIQPIKNSQKNNQNSGKSLFERLFGNNKNPNER